MKYLTSKFTLRAIVELRLSNKDLKFKYVQSLTPLLPYMPPTICRNFHKKVIVIFNNILISLIVVSIQFTFGNMSPMALSSRFYEWGGIFTTGRWLMTTIKSISYEVIIKIGEKIICLSLLILVQCNCNNVVDRRIQQTLKFITRGTEDSYRSIDQGKQPRRSRTSKSLRCMYTIVVRYQKKEK